MEHLQRRFDELLSTLAILGPDQCTVDALHPPELFAALLQGQFDCSNCTHLADQQTQLTLLLHPPGAPPARLHLHLPPAYPGAAALAVVAVTCDALGRQWEQQALQQLKELAAEEECVYQLAEALVALLQQAGAAGPQLGVLHQHEHLQPGAAQQQDQEAQQQQPQQAQARQQQAQQAQQQQSSRSEAHQLALLKLDHMHNRASYSRLIRRWAGELGLAGRLLFCGSSSIILIVLCGPDDGLKEFLLRMRTRNVDVDSKGRPCRERMMTVLAIADCGAKSHVQDNNSSSSSSSAAACMGDPPPGTDHRCNPACACGGPCQHDKHPQLFDTFAEEDVNVAQLAAHLRAAGLLQHWSAATGLPPPG